MAQIDQAGLSELVQALTRAYHRLGALAERLHGPSGLSAGARSILLLLAKRWPLTLSEIADERGVSRQFIQKVAQPLIAGGLIVAEANPRHVRSPKLRLTQRGECMVAQVHTREVEMFVRVGGKLDPLAVREAVALFDQVNVALAQELAAHTHPSRT